MIFHLNDIKRENFQLRTSRTRSQLSIHKPLGLYALNFENDQTKSTSNMPILQNLITNINKPSEKTNQKDPFNLTKFYTYRNINRSLTNTISKSTSNLLQNNTFISVYCRFRPINKLEQEHSKNSTCVKILSDKQIAIHNDTSEYFQQNFSFDKVFSQTTTQEEVFQDTSKEIINSVIQGYNGTIMAYGQTSSGKTYTMKGEDNNHGIIPRTIKEIFNLIENDNNYSIRISFLEIYMEKIRDLFDLTKTNLQILEGKNKQIKINNLTNIQISNEDEFNDLYQSACKNITTCVTSMNDYSSRAHSIMIIKIIHLVKRTTGKLFLVDLAGSEKTSKTHCQGINLEEAKTINKSLSQLGLIIKALTDNQSSHVPYRDSKLTRILGESIGGNSKTCLILTCSPSMFNFDETMSTLRFGARAKKIRNKPIINKEETKAELRAKIDEINTELNKKNIYIKELLKKIDFLSQGSIIEKETCDGLVKETNWNYSDDYYNTNNKDEEIPFIISKKENNTKNEQMKVKGKNVNKNVFKQEYLICKEVNNYVYGTKQDNGKNKIFNIFIVIIILIITFLISLFIS